MRNTSKNITSTNYNSVYHRKIEINKVYRKRARRRKITDRLIQCKVKLDRHKSASAVKVEIENELRISLHVDTIRNRVHEVRLFGRVARQKQD